MTTTVSPSAVLTVIEPAFSDAEKVALAGFLADYSGLTRRRTHRTRASSPPGAASGSCARSSSGVPTSSCSPAISKPRGAPAPRSPAGCPP